MKKPKLKEYALTGYIPPDYDDENYEEGDEGSYMHIHVLATSLEEANEILTDLEEDVFGNTFMLTIILPPLILVN